MLWDVIFN